MPVSLRRAGDERGQALPLLVLLLVAALGAVLLVGRLAGAGVSAARARTAADAAALAGATVGDDAARRLADRNGSRVVSFARAGDVVTVEAENEGQRARARATAVPAGGGGGHAGRLSGVAPAVRAAVSRASQILGRPVIAEAVAGDPLAVDIASNDADAVGSIAARLGLHRLDEPPGRFRLGAG